MSVAIHFARDYDDVVIYLALRRYELGIASRVLDECAGCPSGWQSKIEAGCKTMGRSFQHIAGALGVLYLPVEGGLLLVADDSSIPPVTRRHINSRGRASHSVTEKRRPLPAFAA